jgi:hypothetical protein
MPMRGFIELEQPSLYWSEGGDKGMIDLVQHVQVWVLKKNRYPY